MECMRALVAKDRQVEGCWTGYNASLERSVLKKAKYLEEELAGSATAAPGEAALRPSAEIRDAARRHSRRVPRPAGGRFPLRGKIGTGLA